MGIPDYVKRASTKVKQAYKDRQERIARQNEEEIERLEKRKAELAFERGVKTKRKKLAAEVKQLKRETSTIHRLIGQVEDDIRGKKKTTRKTKKRRKRKSKKKTTRKTKKRRKRKSKKKTTKKKTHKGHKVHTGPRGGKYIMVRKKGGGTRRKYVK